MLVKAALDGGWWWLATGLIVMGLLSTLALGRVFLLAYWRPGEAALEAATSPATSRPLGLAVVAVMTALTLGFGLYPEPLIAAAREAQPA